VGDGGLSQRRERRLALDHVDAGLLTQRADAPGESGDDVVFPLDHRRQVDRRVGVDADVFGPGRTMGDVRPGEQCLGGNAPVVQTGPADGVPFDERRVEPAFARPDGGDVPSGPATHDQYLRAGCVGDHSLPTSAGGCITVFHADPASSGGCGGGRNGRPSVWWRRGTMPVVISTWDWWALCRRLTSSIRAAECSFDGSDGTRDTEFAELPDHVLARTVPPYLGRSGNTSLRYLIVDGTSYHRPR